MSLHHTMDEICLLCESKLTQARPALGTWFRATKKRHPDLHCCCSYRNKEDQEKAVAAGLSRAKYPDSPHNKTDEDGTPLSDALDIFQISFEKITTGSAIFDPIFCAKLNKENKELGYKLLWGGEFKHLGDYDHFQIDESEST